MTISSRVRQEFYSQLSVDTTQLIRIPPTRRAARPPSKSGVASPCTASEEDVEDTVTNTVSPAASSTCSPSPNSFASRLWTDEEHERFLEAIEKFPHGPWKAIADHIGNKTARQVMSHAQKYRQKIARRKRGLQVARRKRKTTENKTPNTTSTRRKQRTRLTATQKLAMHEQHHQTCRMPMQCESPAVHCLWSPSEVSSSPAMGLHEYEQWNTASKAQHHEKDATSSQCCDLFSYPVGDHEAIVATVSDFLENLEVEELDIDADLTTNGLQVLLENSLVDQNSLHPKKT